MTSSNPRLRFIDKSLSSPFYSTGGHAVAATHDIKLSTLRVAGEQGRCLHEMDVRLVTTALAPIRAVDQSPQAPKLHQCFWNHSALRLPDHFRRRKAVEQAKQRVSLFRAAAKHVAHRPGFLDATNGAVSCVSAGVCPSDLRPALQEPQEAARLAVLGQLV